VGFRLAAFFLFFVGSCSILFSLELPAATGNRLFRAQIQKLRSRLF
jgi:hypothetical protein